MSLKRLFQILVNGKEIIITSDMDDPRTGRMIGKKAAEQLKKEAGKTVHITVKEFRREE